MSYALQFPAGTNLHAALLKLRPLEEEDPSLHLVWNESLQEVQVQLMGAVQKEILEQIPTQTSGLVSVGYLMAKGG